MTSHSKLIFFLVHLSTKKSIHLSAGTVEWGGGGGGGRLGLLALNTSESKTFLNICLTIRYTINCHDESY